MGPPADCPLSDREYEVVRLLAAGDSYEDAARTIGASPSSLRTHVFNANRKTGSNSAAQLVARCYLCGWLPVPRRREAILADVQDQLAAAILALAQEREAEAQRKRDELTPGQALYVHAFEQWLRDQSQEHALEQAFMLRAMYYERAMISGRDLVPPWEVLGEPIAPHRRRPRLKVFPITVRPRISKSAVSPKVR
jgi:DNA-binding CsgD family transcriptional regulator